MLSIYRGADTTSRELQRALSRREHLGRLIYLVDCFVDLSRDIRSNQFNGLTASFGSDPDVLARAGRHAIAAIGEAYLRAANTALTSLVTERQEDIVRNILTAGVPRQVYEHAAKDLARIPDARSGGLINAQRVLLTSLLCLVAADAAAGQFVWGDRVTDSPGGAAYKAYGYDCHCNSCPCLDWAECILNPLSCRIYEWGAGYACIPQLPRRRW